jgi:hypothetical protein
MALLRGAISQIVKKASQISRPQETATLLSKNGYAVF